MPIKIPNNLPARAVLESENVFVMTEHRAMAQDIRPLKIIILNLMPTKIETETQLLRVMSNSPLQVEVEFLQTASYISKNTSQSHMSDFYCTFSDICHNKYDGMIITGAPVEHLDFEHVDYWDELREIMDWSRRNVYSTLHICWGALAGLYHHFGIGKYNLPQKLSGIYVQKLLEPLHPLVRGFDDVFCVPFSTNSAVRFGDIQKYGELITLASSDDAGVSIVAHKNGRQVFLTGHSEYRRETLAGEYTRDAERGLEPTVPKNYFPDDNPDLMPVVTWRAHANLLFSNWLNYYVYQQTPYDLNELINSKF